MSIKNHLAVANMAFFLLEKTGSVCGYWKGHMKAKQQRELFGAFLGKGIIHLDGSNETIKHSVSRCFGLDYEITFESNWAKLIYSLTKKGYKVVFIN